MKTTIKSFVVAALAAVGLGVLPTVAKEVSQTFADMGFENASVIGIIDLGDVKISFDKGSVSATPKYYESPTAGSAIRCYAGNTFTVSATNESTILTSIKLTFGSATSTNTVSTDNGNYDNGTGIWQAVTDTSSVKFSIDGTAGNRQLAGITVIYTPPKSATQVELEKIFDVANTATMVKPEYDADGNLTGHTVILGQNHGPVAFSNDFGSVTIDLNGWKIVGADGADGTATTAGGNGVAAITVAGECGAAMGETLISATNNASRPTSGSAAAIVGGNGGNGNPAGKGAFAVVDATGAEVPVSDPLGLVKKGEDGVGTKGLCLFFDGESDVQASAEPPVDPSNWFSEPTADEVSTGGLSAVTWSATSKGSPIPLGEVAWFENNKLNVHVDFSDAAQQSLVFTPPATYDGEQVFTVSLNFLAAYDSVDDLPPVGNSKAGIALVKHEDGGVCFAFISKLDTIRAWSVSGPVSGARVEEPVGVRVTRKSNGTLVYEYKNSSAYNPIGAGGTVSEKITSSRFCGSGLVNSFVGQVNISVYTITYMSADGSTPFTSFKSGYTAPATFTAASPVTLPTAENVDSPAFTFTGWTNSLGVAVTTTAGAYSNLVLYADVEAKTYAVRVPAVKGVDCAVTNQSGAVSGSKVGDFWMYDVTYGDKVDIYLTPAKGYLFEDGTSVKKISYDNIIKPVTVPASDIPKVKEKEITYSQVAATEALEFTVDSRTGERVIDGSAAETFTYSAAGWDKGVAGSASIAYTLNGGAPETFAEGLTGNGDTNWLPKVNGKFAFTHTPDDAEGPLAATFVVAGLTHTLTIAQTNALTCVVSNETGVIEGTDGVYAINAGDKIWVVFTPTEDYHFTGDAPAPTVYDVFDGDVTIAEGDLPETEPYGDLFFGLVRAAQRYPWNGKVDIIFAVTNLRPTVEYALATAFTVKDTDFTKAQTNDLPTVWYANGVHTNTVNVADASWFGADSLTNAPSKLSVKLLRK